MPYFARKKQATRTDEGRPVQINTCMLRASECALGRKSARGSAPACRRSRWRWARGPENGTCTADSSPSLVILLAGSSGTARRGGGTRPSACSRPGSGPPAAKPHTLVKAGPGVATGVGALQLPSLQEQSPLHHDSPLPCGHSAQDAALWLPQLTIVPAGVGAGAE